MENQLTTKQAYKAMFLFIHRYSEHTAKPVGIGNMLSDIQLLSHLHGDLAREGDANCLHTVALASWNDWVNAVEATLNDAAN